MIRQWFRRVVDRMADRLMDHDWLEMMRFREDVSREAVREDRRRQSIVERDVFPARRREGR